MNRSALVLAFLIAGGLIWTPGHAQIRVTTISADMGLIRNLHNQMFSDNLFSVYPELKVGGPLLEGFLNWALYWGYWDDGIDEPLAIADYVTYSFSSHIVGARAILYPLPSYLIIGVSRHFIYGDYIGGAGFDGQPGQDFTDEITTAELGIGISVALSDLYRLRLEFIGYLPFADKDRFNVDGGRVSFRTGFDYFFR